MSTYKGVKTLEILEGADNYNNWIISRLTPYIQSPALEIGSGTGNISIFFKDIDKLVVSDIDHDLVIYLKEKFKKNTNIKIKHLDISKNSSKIRERFRTIFSVNVLEHIEDDEGSLKNIYSMLDSKGRFVALVPAKKFAYSKLDEGLGHHRRYEKKELQQKLIKAGFKVEKIDYFNAVGLISWLVRDRISRNHNQLKKSQVKIFDMIVPVLRKIEPESGLPMGISLIAVVRK